MGFVGARRCDKVLLENQAMGGGRMRKMFMRQEWDVQGTVQWGLAQVASARYTTIVLALAWLPWASGWVDAEKQDIIIKNIFFSIDNVFTKCSICCTCTFWMAVDYFCLLKILWSKIFALRIFSTARTAWSSFLRKPGSVAGSRVFMMSHAYPSTENLAANQSLACCYVTTTY